MNLRKLASAAAVGAALLVPTLLPADAAAQDRRGRGHDNGLHRGWDKNGKRGDDRGRSDWDRDRRNRDRIQAQRRRIDANRDRFVRERADRNRWNDRRDDNRQNQKNTWRNLGYAGGAAGLYGLLTGNKTIAALGLGGGLYSAYRYEQDRKSQSRDSRGRYELFRRDAFDHNGHHYVRRTKKQGGQNYYYFQRTR